MCNAPPPLFTSGGGVGLVEVIGQKETGWDLETDILESQHYLHHSSAVGLRQVTSPP